VKLQVRARCRLLAMEESASCAQIDQQRRRVLLDVSVASGSFDDTEAPIVLRNVYLIPRSMEYYC
jgi:hypothetical protein